MKIKNSLLYIISFFFIDNCSKTNDHQKSQYTNPKQQIAAAFFTKFPHHDALGNGLWVADQKDFEKYIHDRYLKQYRPAPNENNPDTIKALLKDSYLFFRIDKLKVGQLFIVKNYDLSVSAGQMMLDRRENSQEIYALLLQKRTPDGKKYLERSMLHYDTALGQWYYFTEGYRIRLTKETRKEDELKQLYVDGLATSLKEY